MPSLDWLNKKQSQERAGGVPYRLLRHEASLSYGAASSNMLIEGDNLEALKALLPYYAGKVKCVFIDPPYNTKSAFEHYDDNLEHSQWLDMIYPRLELLRELMAEDGSIWVTIDDNEAHYLKVIMDEVFGRINYIGSLIWQKRKGGGNDSFFMAIDHDYVLLYTKNSNKKIHKPWRVAYDGEYLKRYKEMDENGKRFYWDTLARDGLRNPIPVEIDCPDGTKININSQKSKRTILDKIADNSIRLIKNKNGWTLHHKVMMPEGKVARSILDIGTNKNSNDEVIDLFGKEIGFDYAKPESLIKIILEMATKEGDLVLDSFLGSGTTAAVAHKMGRSWIGIEIGAHARTHAVPRLCKVIDGEQGGISQAVGWQGGGGFRFYQLGEPIFNPQGQINPAIAFAELAHHIWFSETRQPLAVSKPSPLLGVDKGIAYYLLYNGILGDKRANGGNVLTQKILALLPSFAGPKVIYGETCRLSPARLEELQITFKQTPYDIKAR